MFFKALLAAANINLWLILPGDFASPGHCRLHQGRAGGRGTLGQGTYEQGLGRDNDHRLISQQDPTTSSEPPSPEAGFWSSAELTF